MKKTTIWAIIVVLIIVIAGYLLYQNQVQVQDEKEPIQIGAIFMLTGLGSSQGEQSKLGTELAVKEINESGGINGRKIVMQYEDDKSDDPSEALTAFRKLLFDNVEIIIGPNWSSCGQALAPVACEKKTLLISPSVGISGFAKECNYIFNLWPSDYKNSKSLGEFVVELGYKNVAILGSEQVWEKEQADAVKEGVEENGGNVTSLIITLRDETDFRTDILREPRS